MTKFDLSKYITKYINNPDTESALLISAQWGAGKTFFIKDYIDCLENSSKDVKPVYYSLKGISDVQLLIKSLLLRVLINTRTKKKERILGFLNFLHLNSDNILGLFEDRVLTHAYKCLSTFSEILFSSIGESFIKKVSPNNIVLFLDDLERVSSKIKVIDLVAEINTTFIENNIKVIYIADESKLLKNNCYKEAKEKYIQRTYSFVPDKEEIFKIFSDMYFPNPDPYEIFYQMFICAFDEEQINLRSVKFAFSLFSEMLQKYQSWTDIDNYSHPLQLFYSVCAYSNFYNKYQLKKSTLIKNVPTFWDSYVATKDETETEQDKICKDFYSKYQNNNFYLYAKKFLIDFIYDGNLNEDKLKEFLFLKTEKEDPLSKLSNIYKLEFEDLINLFNEIRGNLENYNYSIYNLNQLYGDFYKRLDYDKSIKKEDKQKIKKLITESIFDKKNEEDLKRFFEFAKKNNESVIKFPPEIPDEITKEINKKYSNYLKQSKNDAVDELFNAIQEANLDNGIFTSIDEHKIFSMLDRKGYLEKILELKNISINFVIYLIQSKILGLGNACDFYMSEIPTLEKLKEIIKERITTINRDDPLKAELLENLSKVIDAAVKHINESRNFY